MFSVRVPNMGASTVDVDLIKWHVAVGDMVNVGTILADIESEKTTIELEAEVAGRIDRILVEEGATIEVGTVVCMIEPS
jgi:pyruvate/2-oxoglutarate dehydrogenase complex dihydrolipoamide acyltransferase (E2) component